MKYQRSRRQDRSRAVTSREALASVLSVLALAAATQGAMAQAIIIDPRSVPTGSPLSGSSTSADSAADAGVTPQTGSINSSSADSAQPFQAGRIGSADRSDPLPETARRRADVRQQILPAEPNEFEKYVRATTGRRIRRFGENLLVPANADFNLPATMTVPGDYPIEVGDLVSVNTTGSIEGSADFTVDRNGEIFLPQVGKVKLVGVRYRDLRDRIAQAIGTKYRGFEATVSIKRLHGIRVYVTGFANQPGAYSVSSLSTLVNAVLAAGGPASGGSFRSIKLYRNGREVTDFDLYDLVRGGDRSRDAILQNEDVQFISPVGQQIAIVGSVNEEAIYEARAGESVSDVLRIAGGPNTLADTLRVILYSLDDKGTVGSRELVLGEITGKPIAGGDIVQVLSQGSLAFPLERQSVVVRLEGEVNKPGNYFVAPNTPLSQVIEQAGGLTTRAYVYGTKLTRASVREQQRQGYADALDQLETLLVSAPLSADQTISAADREAQLRAANGLLDKLRRSEPDGRLVLEVPYSAATLPGDLLLENNDAVVIPPRIDTIGVFGAVYRPASFRLSGRPVKVRDFVERAGGPTRFADKGNIFVVRANGDVLTRKKGALSATVQAGDVVFLPVKAQSSSFWAKFREITQVIFQLGLSAATVAAID
jgi:protein involved in polysaccharide export with SLBB domain